MVFCYHAIVFSTFSHMTKSRNRRREKGDVLKRKTTAERKAAGIGEARKREDGRKKRGRVREGGRGGAGGTRWEEEERKEGSEKEGEEVQRREERKEEPEKEGGEVQREGRKRRG